MSSISGWERYSNKAPCPICGGDKPCARAPSGQYHCHRTHQDVPGYTYLGDTPADGACGASGKFVAEGEYRRVDWTPRVPTAAGAFPDKAQAVEAKRAKGAEAAASVMAHASSDPADLGEMAYTLRVPSAGLEDLGVQYVPPGQVEHPIVVTCLAGCWVFPERDETGRIIGLTQRYTFSVNDTNKPQTTGSTRGCYFNLATDWATVDLLCVPEGGSDTAALLAAGIDAIGRPSAQGGGDILTAVAAKLSPDCKVVVMAEQDRHENKAGQMVWPGMDGAKATARKLANKLGRTVYIWLPEDGSKDVRDYLANQKIIHGDYKAAGDKLRNDLLGGDGLVAVEPDPDKLAASKAQGGPSENSSLLNTEGRDESSSPPPIPPTDDATLLQIDMQAFSLPPAFGQILDEEDRRPCPDSINPVIQSEANQHNLRVLCKGCGKAKCPICRTTLKASWALHAQQSIIPTAGQLHAGVLPSRDGVAKEADKLGAEYVTVQQQGGGVFVMADRPLTGLSPVAGRTEALQAFCEALLNLPALPPTSGPWRPVTSSHGWSRAEREPRSDRWNIISTIPGRDMPAVEEQLRARADLQASKVASPCGWRWELMLPRWWPKESILAFARFSLRAPTAISAEDVEAALKSPFGPPSVSKTTAEDDDS